MPGLSALVRAISIVALLAPWAPPVRAADKAVEPIGIHPDNPKYFLFRGKPLVLLTATEHYGSVLNRAFDCPKYLDDVVDKRMTLTRTFLLFRELASAQNPASTCKPNSPDYIAPWPRTGPGKAQDGEPQYDLSRWNEEYFERLHRFFQMASDLGIVIEATIFSNSYGDHIWALNPLHPANNIQGVGASSYLRTTLCSMKRCGISSRNSCGRS